MESLRTLTGKRFNYKIVAQTDAQEMIVYPSDRSGRPQDKFALVITPFVTRLVKDQIRHHGPILMGASRDNPPPRSLGAALKSEGLTPQMLSYLVPILIEQGYCRVEADGKAFLVTWVIQNHRGDRPERGAGWDER